MQQDYDKNVAQNKIYIDHNIIKFEGFTSYSMILRFLKPTRLNGVDVPVTWSGELARLGCAPTG